MLSSPATLAKHIIAAVQNTGFGRLIRRYTEDRADLLAGIVAFNALFAMFPVILGVLTIVGFIFRSPGARAQAQALVLTTLPSSAAVAVLEALNGASKSAGLLALVSLVGVLWGGITLFGALEVALDRIYRVPSRPFVRQMLMSVAMMLLFALLVVTELVATTVAQLVGRLTQSVPLVGPGVAPSVVAGAGGAISVLAAFALCFAIYYFVPNLRLTARQVLPGTLVASLGLVLLTQMFPLYALFLGGSNQYGAIFGLFFLLMTWAFLVAEALMIGGELNAFTQSQPDRRKLADDRRVTPVCISNPSISLRQTTDHVG